MERNDVVVWSQKKVVNFYFFWGRRKFSIIGEGYEYSYKNVYEDVLAVNFRQGIVEIKLKSIGYVQVIVGREVIESNKVEIVVIKVQRVVIVILILIFFRSNCYGWLK